MNTDVRESHMFISDGLTYLHVILPTDEDMESYPKEPLTPAGEWKLSYMDGDGQCNYSDNDSSFGYNVSATSLPNQTISSSPSYQRQNARPPASLFEMMWPSPRLILTMHSS